jgi:hypothetical protein
MFISLKPCEITSTIWFGLQWSSGNRRQRFASLTPGLPGPHPLKGVSQRAKEAFRTMQRPLATLSRRNMTAFSLLVMSYVLLFSAFALVHKKAQELVAWVETFRC